MTELDKKMQKTQADLVQSVLEAVDKKNNERCDMLISNAFKQLKMSRFKPDQTVCISLTYLARICPQCFSQSNNLKDLLKTYIRRDNGPTSIKSAKNDYVLPVLAANILLACCDGPELRVIILNRIEQWIGSQQRLNEPIVQHLIATLCVRCQGDPPTIKTLIDIRSHWINFLENNYETYGQASTDLSRAIRDRLSSETNCESLVEILCFLRRHDSDVTGLTSALSELITRRPITFDTWLDHQELGDQLKQTIMGLFNRLFEQLSPAREIPQLREPVFIEIPSSTEFSVLEEVTLEAIMTLMASGKLVRHLDHADLLVCWLRHLQTKPVIGYKDVARTTPYEIPTSLITKLVNADDMMAELALKCATPTQLIELVHHFGLASTKLKKIFEKLAKIDAEVLLKLGFNSSAFFNELMQLYSEMGVDGAEHFAKLEHCQEDHKNIKQEPLPTGVKIKTEAI